METTRRILVHIMLIACLVPTIDARRGGGRGGRGGGGMRRSPRRGASGVGRAARPGRDRRGTAWRGGRRRGADRARWRRSGRDGRRWRDGRRGRRWRHRRGWGWGPYINVGWPWYWGGYDGYYDDYYPDTVYVQSTDQAQQYLDDQQLTYWVVTNSTDEPLLLTNAAGDTTTLNPGQQTQISHAQGFDLEVASVDGRNRTTITPRSHFVNF